MRKILIPLVVLLALGACSNSPEKPVEAPEVIPSSAPSLNPEDSSQSLSVPTFKYGEAFTYLDGLKITIYKPQDAEVNPANNFPEFNVKVEAPNGWMAEEQGSWFTYRLADGDVSTEIYAMTGNGPFSENLQPGTKKTFRMQLASKDRTGTIVLTGMDIPQAEWS